MRNLKTEFDEFFEEYYTDDTPRELKLMMRLELRNAFFAGSMVMLKNISSGLLGSPLEKSAVNMLQDYQRQLCNYIDENYKKKEE